MQPALDHTALAASLVETMRTNRDLLRAIALEELRWLTVQDICRITGRSKKTVLGWGHLGLVRFFQVEEGKFQTTLTMWREDERRLIEEGLIR